MYPYAFIGVAYLYRSSLKWVVFNLSKIHNLKQFTTPHTLTFAEQFKDIHQQAKAQIHHEFGHYVDAKMGRPSSKGIKHSISEYGDKTNGEGFAEWYSYYRMKGTKGLPTELKEIFEEYDNSLVTLFETKKYWDISIIDNGKYNNGITNKIDWIELHNGINITARKHGINIDDFSVYIDNENVRFFVSGKNFELQRTFKILDSGIIDVHHDLFEIDEIYQGKGISKEIFKILYAQYKKIGVDQISVFANIDIGGYTWARYGFYAKNKFSALRAVRSDNAKKFIEQYYIDNSLSVDAPFPMRLITEHFDGKEELLDKNWNGILNLNDDKARGIFEKYIGW